MSDVVDVAIVGIQDETGAQCTGALIAPNLVLTAQHCVAPLVGFPNCTTGQGGFGPPRAASSFHVTTKATFTFSPGDYHSVTAIRLPPGSGICGRDVALLVLRDLVAATEADDIVPRVDTAPQPSELYAAVGFGGTDDLGTGAGERRRRDGLTVACLGADDGGCGGVSASEWLGEAGVCGGDSGGPALDALGRVIGVASRGAVDCTMPIYADLHAHAAWLMSEAQAAATTGGYQAPAWVTGPVDAGSLDAGSVDAGSVDGSVDAGPVDAGPAAPDAGGADAGTVDGGGGSGCGCRATPPIGWAFVLAAIALLRRRSLR